MSWFQTAFLIGEVVAGIVRPRIAVHLQRADAEASAAAVRCARDARPRGRAGCRRARWRARGARRGGASRWRWAIQAPRGSADGAVINAAAYTHTSIAVRDALLAVKVPFVEVHLSNVDERDEWRRFSVLTGLGGLRVVGKGFDGYRAALALLDERRPA